MVRDRGFERAACEARRLRKPVAARRCSSGLCAGVDDPDPSAGRPSAIVCARSRSGEPEAAVPGRAGAVKREGSPACVERGLAARGGPDAGDLIVAVGGPANEAGGAAGDA
eukprot:CAMPEP_0184722388 /NCGR_PEP_ID=MMETSP0314-20130426/21969_1 /TAXON_ID=38298 /ORGANISM="Rhodella maculata, Strain CCMP 736" /LENGTH=110 /DNA_ID=CAMNT_0027186975 /DNA_START=182 /DNA_END=514 /DNA_ORIENTATION=+